MDKTAFFSTLQPLRPVLNPLDVEAANDCDDAANHQAHPRRQLARHNHPRPRWVAGGLVTFAEPGGYLPEAARAA